MTTFSPGQCALEELEDLVCRARAELLAGPIACVAYPEGSGPTNWDDAEISRMNRDLLSSLSGRGNVYALFAGERGRWTAMYVGERKRQKLRERMRQHLIKAHGDTGSQLANVRSAVGEGKRIGISYVLIEPEPLRHYVEECIVAASADGELPWNKHR